MTEHDTFAGELLAFVDALAPLGDLPRTGWLLRGVVPCESIADHVLGVALVTLKLVDRARREGHVVDGERALRLALLHDAPEAKTGDIPMPIKSAELDRALGEVERRIAEELLGADAALLDEYETRSTIEAMLVRAADKIQMLARALAYETQRGARLDDFFEREVRFDEGTPAFCAEVIAELRRRRR